ncbi:hypothetical protein GKZ90_0013865 [Flavobacterium sp. MC2016-06]|uniref:hypothetical protein n=1 Tax=Flavobacterium sp. MC2016-06 TaxID=2676308 RepID=UPI0012BA83C9|nr:hypothetical protein [Flavobacterium sp. MC2016-06]MBU3861746.1 hypothetical protein [Flavobacterium sp. MC2016-06]
MSLKVYIFGNGNLSFNDYMEYYQNTINKLLKIENVHFIVCDFKGVDTLTMEMLKCTTNNVTILHIGEKPRYSPDKYKTKVSQWNFIGGFESDLDRDTTAINMCTHFLAFDTNSNEKRKSGTLTNIEICLQKSKIEAKSLFL